MLVTQKWSFDEAYQTLLYKKMETTVLYEITLKLTYPRFVPEWRLGNASTILLANASFKAVGGYL